MVTHLVQGRENNTRKTFGIDISRQLTNLVPKRAHQWTVEEDVPGYFFHPGMSAKTDLKLTSLKGRKFRANRQVSEISVLVR